MKTISLLLLLLTTALACAQELPDAPQPKTTVTAPTTIKKVETKETYWTKPMVASLSAAILTRTLDTVQTCRYMRQRAIITVSDVHRPGFDFKGGTFVQPVFHEAWAPVDSCGGIVAWNTGGTGLLLTGNYLLNKTGHRRTAQILNWVSTAGSTYAIIHNIRNHRVDLSGFTLPEGATISVKIR